MYHLKGYIYVFILYIYGLMFVVVVVVVGFIYMGGVWTSLDRVGMQNLAIIGVSKRKKRKKYMVYAVDRTTGRVFRFTCGPLAAIWYKLHKKKIKWVD
jgi:hypothetical protein